MKCSLNHLFEIISLLFGGFIWFRGKLEVLIRGCSKSNILTHHTLSVASWIFFLQVQQTTAHVETDTVIDEVQQKMRKTLEHEQHLAKNTAGRLNALPQSCYGCILVFLDTNLTCLYHFDVKDTQRGNVRPLSIVVLQVWHFMRDIRS